MEAYREEAPESFALVMERVRRTTRAGCAWCQKPFYEEDTFGEDGGRISMGEMGSLPWRYYCSRDCIMRAAGEW